MYEDKRKAGLGPLKMIFLSKERGNKEVGCLKERNSGRTRWRGEEGNKLSSLSVCIILWVSFYFHCLSVLFNWMLFLVLLNLCRSVSSLLFSRTNGLCIYCQSILLMMFSQPLVLLLLLHEERRGGKSRQELGLSWESNPLFNSCLDVHIPLVSVVVADDNHSRHWFLSVLFSQEWIAFLLRWDDCYLCMYSSFQVSVCFGHHHHLIGFFLLQEEVFHRDLWIERYSKSKVQTGLDEDEMIVIVMSSFSFGSHEDRDKFFVVYKTISIQVCFSYHVFYFFICQLLSQVCHDMS